jgi:putative DNA primase/helicase
MKCNFDEARSVIEEIQQFCLPTDFAGTVFLALTAGVIGRSITLEMRKGQEWVETSNIWAVLVGNPSSKKSPTYRRISRLLASLEKIAAAEHHRAVVEYRDRKKAAKDSQIEFDENAPVMRRYTTDDCTTPKLRELMGNNLRGIILHNDELKGQLEKLDKPGSEGDRSFMMQCWSGLEVYNEDRMTRLGGYKIPLALTWVGCIPPAALALYLRQAQSYGSGADGFMQRFQMVTFPDINQRYELCKETVPPELEKELQRFFVDLDKEALNNSERVLHFDEAAQRHFDLWQIALENDCRSGDHPSYWESHLGKQAKLLASLCIVLHRLFELSSGQSSNAISLSTLQGAMNLRGYYQEHAQRCYDSIESIEVMDARKILELIKKKRLPLRFKAQDIYHHGLGGVKESQRVRAALELLHGANWVAHEKIMLLIFRTFL